jgi:hypothetical protein
MFVNFMQTTPPASKVQDFDVDDIKRQLQAHEIRLNSLAKLLFGDILKVATDGATSDEAGRNGSAE